MTNVSLTEDQLKALHVLLDFAFEIDIFGIGLEEALEEVLPDPEGTHEDEKKRGAEALGEAYNVILAALGNPTTW
jgi:hypothetical protein